MMHRFSSNDSLLVLQLQQYIVLLLWIDLDFVQAALLIEFVSSAAQQFCIVALDLDLSVL